MTSTRYRLIEATQLPRAARVGHLTDMAGIPLHGTYERKTRDGYRATLINNGRALHRYNYERSIADQPAVPTRSFANLVHTLAPWQVPHDAERPVTDYPRSEYPMAAWRSLWSEPGILVHLLEGTKLVGLLAGDDTMSAHWASTARQHGLLVRRTRTWTDGLGQHSHLTLVARPGPLAREDDLQILREEYKQQLPGFRTAVALQRLSQLTGELAPWQRLVNPEDDDDLVISGYCFGYPVASTAAAINGTHG